MNPVWSILPAQNLMGNAFYKFESKLHVPKTSASHQQQCYNERDLYA